MSERSFYGHWWEPDGPDATTAGILTVAEDGDIQLELVGGIDLINKTVIAPGAIAVHEGNRDLPILYGMCEGIAVTLLNCIPTLTRGGWTLEQPSFQRLLANRALVGVHLEKEDAPVFRAATMRIENLTAWASLPTVARSAGYDNGATNAELRLVDPLVVTVDDWEFKAGPSLRGFNIERTRESVAAIGDATTELRAKPPQLSRLSDFDHVAAEFTDLLTLATDTPCGLISVQLELDDDDLVEMAEGKTLRRPRTVEVLGPRIHVADGSAPAVQPHQCLFTCHDMPFEEIVPAWLAIRRAAPFACNVYFGLRYARPTYTEMRLLSVATSLESFHHDLVGDATPEMSKEHFDALRVLMLAAIDDEADRAWVKEKLRNAPSFRERARAMAAIPESSAVSWVVPDVETWAADLVKARNGLAHAAGAGLGLGIFTLERSTFRLLALVLMVRLGFSDEVQERAAKNVLRIA